jgi:hypothetical protein
MTPSQEVDYIVHDCLFAVGQAVGVHGRIDYEAVVWLRARYREKFLHAMIQNGNSWAKDRHRVTAVSRYLGQRAVHHARDSRLIDVPAVVKASADVEQGCQMNAVRESLLNEPPVCTNSSASAF